MSLVTQGTDAMLADVIIELRARLDAEQPWRLQAACRGDGPARFYPGRGPNKIPAVCSRCPVHDDCLAHALERPEPLGTWGGTSERQRRRQRKLITASE